MFPSVIDAEISQSGFLSILRAGILWCFFAEYLLLNVLLSEGRYFLDSAHVTQPKLVLPGFKDIGQILLIHGTQNKGGKWAALYLWQIFFLFSHLLLLGEYSRNKLLSNADLHRGSILAVSPLLLIQKTSAGTHQLDLFFSTKDRQDFSPTTLFPNFYNSRGSQCRYSLGTFSFQKDS